MPRRRLPFPRLLVIVVLLAGVVFAFREGLVPARYSPLPALSLETAPGMFVDWQLAALRQEPELCRDLLRPPHIDAAPVPDNPLRNGCGWTNAVRFTSAAGARIGVDKLSCEAAAAVALWLMNDVQPLAITLLGQRIAAVQDMGTYACRNIIGNPLWKDKRSEHATANAIDIAGFTTEDGRHISVQRHWADGGAEGRFLRAVHQSACRYFRVALGPDFNRSHHDHFHLDRGILSTCR